MSDIMKKARSFLDSPGRQYAESPIPAWAASAASASLLSIFSEPSSNSFSPVLSQLPASKKHYNSKLFPKPWAVFLFSSTLAVGGWMTYDHAPIDGAGTTAAWSILYLMVNGTTKSLKPLFKLRNPVPLGAASLTAVNAITHGYYYFNTSRPKEKAEVRL